jgi:hypothetical protein
MAMGMEQTIQNILNGYSNIIDNYQRSSSNDKIGDQNLHNYFVKLRAIIYKLRLIENDIDKLNLSIIDGKLSTLSDFEKQLINDIDHNHQLFEKFLPVIAMYEYISQHPDMFKSDDLN